MTVQELIERLGKHDSQAQVSMILIGPDGFMLEAVVEDMVNYPGTVILTGDVNEQN